MRIWDANGSFLDLFTDVGVFSSDMDRRVFYASNISFLGDGYVAHFCLAMIYTAVGNAA